MTTTNVFVRKHKAQQLPLKYMRRSVSSLFHRDIRPSDTDELYAIQDQYVRFIETPLGKSPRLED